MSAVSPSSAMSRILTFATRRCLDWVRAVNRVCRATAAALLFLVVSIGDARALPEASTPPSNVAEARPRYERGVALCSEGKFPEGRTELEQAYALAPNS